MSKLPVVAIIGRPNAGKSTLFNRLIGRRLAIVSEVAGTTRDQVAMRVEGEGIDYLLIDTGGMGGGTTDKDFEKDVEAQSLLALERADLILCVINGSEDLTASDRRVAEILRKKRRRHVPVFLIATKCDTQKREEEALPQLHELSMTEHIFLVSAVHGIGMQELEDKIVEQLQELHFKTEAANCQLVAASVSARPSRDGKAAAEVGLPIANMPRIAIVGRPNVGKSSLVNALMSPEQRKTAPRLTSPMPGTTRDATDTVIHHAGREYLFVDTAGLRKQAKVERFGIDAFATLRALTAIEEADVVVLVLDALQDIGKQDKHIASLAIEEGKGLMLLANKTDLLDVSAKQAFGNSVTRAFPFCRFAPVLYTSAETRENLPHLFSLIDRIAENRQRRIPTPALNRLFRDLGAAHQANLGGRSFPAKYATQVEVAPPTFALFLRDPKRLHVSSIRFLENKIRELYAFEGTPIRWIKKS